jgi:hypothetical protein
MKKQWVLSISGIALILLLTVIALYQALHADIVTNTPICKRTPPYRGSPSPDYASGSPSPSVSPSVTPTVVTSASPSPFITISPSPSPSAYTSASPTPLHSSSPSPTALWPHVKNNLVTFLGIQVAQSAPNPTPEPRLQGVACGGQIITISGPMFPEQQGLNNVRIIVLSRTNKILGEGRTKRDGWFSVPFKFKPSDAFRIDTYVVNNQLVTEYEFLIKANKKCYITVDTDPISDSLMEKFTVRTRENYLAYVFFPARKMQHVPYQPTCGGDSI